MPRSLVVRVEGQAGERAAARTDPWKAGEKIRNPANSRWASAAAVERAATTEPAGPVRNDIAAVVRRMQPRCRWYRGSLHGQLRSPGPVQRQLDKPLGIHRRRPLVERELRIDRLSQRLRRQRRLPVRTSHDMMSHHHDVMITIIAGTLGRMQPGTQRSSCVLLLPLLRDVAPQR